MAEWIGVGRRARRCYGFDEIALVPGTTTVNPTEVDTSWQLGGLTFRVPFIASAMDGVVDVTFAIAMGKLGALAVLNLDGVQARYEDPAEAITQVVQGEVEQTTNIVQQLYKAPIQERLVAKNQNSFLDLCLENLLRKQRFEFTKNAVHQSRHIEQLGLKTQFARQRLHRQ